MYVLLAFAGKQLICLQFVSYNQPDFIPVVTPTYASMADTGYAYVPTVCIKGGMGVAKIVVDMATARLTGSSGYECIRRQ